MAVTINGKIFRNVKGANEGITTNKLVLTDLPTSDPHEEGAVWNDEGVLKISTGE